MVAKMLNKSPFEWLESFLTVLALFNFNPKGTHPHQFN
jgi:hypothetical protein